MVNEFKKNESNSFHVEAQKQPFMSFYTHTL